MVLKYNSTMNKLCSLAIAVCISQIAFAQSAPLRLNLKTGETYRQLTNSVITINQVIEGMPFDMSMEVFAGMAYRVESVADGIYQIEVQHEGARLSMEMMGESVSYGADATDTNDIVSVLLHEMKKYPFHIALSDRGKVIQVTKIGDWLAPTMEKLKHFPQELVGPMIDQVLKSYGEEAFKGNIEMVTAIFPDHEVAPGDQWNIKTHLNSTMTADIDTRFTLLRRNKQTVILTGDAVIHTDDTAPATEMSGGTIKYDLSGTMKSEIEIDAFSGWIASATFDQQLEGENVIEAMEAMGNTLKVPMKMQHAMVVGNSEKALRRK